MHVQADQRAATPMKQKANNVGSSHYFLTDYLSVDCVISYAFKTKHYVFSLLYTADQICRINVTLNMT